MIAKIKRIIDWVMYLVLIIANWLAEVTVLMIVVSVAIYLVEEDIVKFNKNISWADDIYYIGLGCLLIPVVNYFYDRFKKITKECKP